jgi:hypothetical protein
MDKEIIIRLHTSFEDMVQKHPDTGTEFWCARDLQMLLGYNKWENFAKVIDRAITACETAKFDPKDHFVRERILFNRLSIGEIEIPDYETQLHASKCMERVGPIVGAIEQELQTINALPSALLRRAFSGEL